MRGNQHPGGFAVKVTHGQFQYVGKYRTSYVVHNMKGGYLKLDASGDTGKWLSPGR